MCFAGEKYRKVNVLKFFATASYLTSTILWWKNIRFMCCGVCRSTPQAIVDPSETVWRVVFEDWGWWSCGEEFGDSNEIGKH